MFLIYLNYALETSVDLIKENSFTLEKTRSKRYPAETMTDIDYADDLVLLTNTPTQAECLLPSLEQTAVGIYLYISANKIEFMSFQLEEPYPRIGGKSLKLVDQFKYLGSNI